MVVLTTSKPFTRCDAFGAGSLSKRTHRVRVHARGFWNQRIVPWHQQDWIGHHAASRKILLYPCPCPCASEAQSRAEALPQSCCPELGKAPDAAVAGGGVTIPAAAVDRTCQYVAEHSRLRPRIRLPSLGAASPEGAVHPD